MLKTVIKERRVRVTEERCTIITSEEGAGFDEPNASPEGNGVATSPVQKETEEIERQGVHQIRPREAWWED